MRKLFQVYEWTTWNDAPSFTYDIDNSANAPAFTRIIYVFKIDKYSVWIEMDDFTGGLADRIGVPLTWAYDMEVTNLVVKYKYDGEFPDANTSTIYNRLNGVQGKINFWPSNYSSNPSGTYDEDDSSHSASDGYGSFQFFDISQDPSNCIFSWSHWGPGIFGMGNRLTSHPDWTFAPTGIYNNNSIGKIYIR